MKYVEKKKEQDNSNKITSSQGMVNVIRTDNMISFEMFIHIIDVNYS